MFFLFGYESGQHAEILPMFSIALDSRVVNMLIFYEYVFFFISGFASGQHFEIQVICHSGLDSRVVNKLRLYQCVLLHWVREWSTC